jgi:hypothetical protein
MWDEMVIVIVIKKDDKMAITFEVAFDVEGSLGIKAPKKKKKEVIIKEKKEKTIDNLVMKKYPKGFDETECKHVDESIKSEF